MNSANSRKTFQPFFQTVNNSQMFRDYFRSSVNEERAHIVLFNLNLKNDSIQTDMYMRPRAAFSRLQSQFFTIRTDPNQANNVFIFCLRLFFSCG